MHLQYLSFTFDLLLWILEITDSTKLEPTVPINVLENKLTFLDQIQHLKGVRNLQNVD